MAAAANPTKIFHSILRQHVSCSSLLTYSILDGLSCTGWQPVETWSTFFINNLLLKFTKISSRIEPLVYLERLWVGILLGVHVGTMGSPCRQYFFSMSSEPFSSQCSVATLANYALILRVAFVGSNVTMHQGSIFKTEH